MKSVLLAFGVGASLLAGAVALWPRRAPEPAIATTAVPPASPEAPIDELALEGLIANGPRLAPSVRALALDGKRVRLVGYMARMEDPPRGGFYLVPRPLFCDESGGGTGDLPPASVLVQGAAADDTVVPFAPGALAVTGIFEVGNRAGADGRVSSFRLRLDGAAPMDVASRR